MNDAQPNPLSCTADEYSAELQRQSRHASDFLRALTPAQFNWQPDGGKNWSIAQCVQHLAVTNQIYLAALRSVVQNCRKARQATDYRPGGWLTRRFIASMEPPPKQRFRAFRKIQPASLQYTVDAVLSRFLAEQEDLARFVSDTRDFDLGAVRFWNPFLKGARFTVSSGLLLVGAHNRRHLWQAERVKETAGFPS